MGRTVSIPQAVNYETRLVKHGLQHHNPQEVFDGLEHLANLSAQKGDGTEAGRITHLFIEELEGDPHAPGDIAQEIKEIHKDPYRVIDPNKVSPEDRYDTTHEPHYNSSH